MPGSTRAKTLGHVALTGGPPSGAGARLEARIGRPLSHRESATTRLVGLLCSIARAPFEVGWCQRVIRQHQFAAAHGYQGRLPGSGYGFEMSQLVPARNNVVPLRLEP